MHIIHLGANGWLARFDEGFDDENVIRVADALGLLWADAHPGATVLIGRDARFRAAHFAKLVGQVIASYGMRVKVSADPCPTPALGWCAAHDDECVGAVMLTASENSCEYGGILVRGADGGAVSSAFLAEVDRAIPTYATKDRGAVEMADFVTPYIEGVIAFLDVDAFRFAHLKVVADPMYGGAITTVGPLLRRLGCEVSLLHAEESHDFVGIHPDPNEPWVDKCERRVVDTGSDCGIVLDGDGDRAALISDEGRLVGPQTLVPLVLRCLSMGRGATGRVVVTTATTERASRQAEMLGLPLTVVPVGFERSYEEVLEGDVLMASEEYGGICIPSHLAERDGIFACLVVLEQMAKSGLSLSELVARMAQDVGQMEYVRRDLRLDGGELQTLRNLLPGMNPRNVAGKKPERVSHLDGLRLHFSNGAWVLLRVSRTQPVARVYAEAPTYKECAQLLEAALALARDPS
ncbi:MAG: phosphoglucomutase [Atopobiaceae bacterium]|nr:phosphoglucomutase [Atopobiaceae bacterium]